MANTRADHDVSDDVVAVIIHLAERLRQDPRPDHTRAGAILDLIKEAVSTERDRCLNTWVHSLPLDSEAEDDVLPF